MANGPEPKDTGNTSPFSVNSQLNAFSEQLDREAEEGRSLTLTLPGFLFRNGRDLSEYFAYARFIHYSGWDRIDEGLLQRHKETFRQASEARASLFNRIEPIKLLEAVRDIWGKGEIRKSAAEATLAYSYLTPVEIHAPSTSHYEQPRALSHYVSHYEGRTTYTGGGKTGMWNAVELEVREKVAVYFGSAKYPPTRLYTAELNDFFADRVDPVYSDRVSIFPSVPIPKKIWTRPDNLVIGVSIPYYLVPVGPSIYFFNAGYTYGFGVEKPYSPNCYSTSDYATPAWFDQNTPHSDMLEFLLKKLDQQRILGQLPSQKEEVELAKIGELKRRGLFIDSPPQKPIYYTYPVYKG